MQVSEYIKEFNQILKVHFEPNQLATIQLKKLLSRLEPAERLSSPQREEALYAHVNNKFDFNAAGIRHFLSYAAHRGITFNYHEKNKISELFDTCDINRLRSFLSSLSDKPGMHKVHIDDLLQQYSAISREETLQLLHSELRNPSITRKDSKPRDWSEEILTSLFSAFVYSSFPERSMHALTDPLTDQQEYKSDFWAHLHRNYPHLFSRDAALIALHVNSQLSNRFRDYKSLRRAILNFVQAAHGKLSNHGYLALLIDPTDCDGESVLWTLYADIVLYAEKHIALEHKQNFFRAEEIQRATTAYISKLDVKRARFEVLHQGFFYQDCFVIGSDQQLLLLFQKHQADETLIPCPRCRSHNVQGNSYSSLGIRSWECNNQFCPDRSKFNRGKRYSFLQLLKQKAIQDVANLIPVESVRRWARDVQPARAREEILEMLVRHYSLAGDTVRLYGWQTETARLLDRQIISTVSFEVPDCGAEGLAHSLSPDDFFESAYFNRYCVERNDNKGMQETKYVEVDGIIAAHGDALDALHELDKNSIDGAVTSPPYYNAREYSQWDNIYTYLYDMYNINKQVYRVLRPGAVYLFNIFDYFDNEKNVSLSAMGDKRMILGAYVVDIFRRMGFKCISNIIWDKGDIEGKRGFNNGNFSPYYQAPFNCWEHIFVFQKPGGKTFVTKKFSTILKQKPVIKMVRGKNTHGHSAPFPESIPRLLLDTVPSGAVILDPFAGSMTTGLAARDAGKKAICIERDAGYFALGLKKLRESSMQKLLV